MVIVADMPAVAPPTTERRPLPTPAGSRDFLARPPAGLRVGLARPGRGRGRMRLHRCAWSALDSAGAASWRRPSMPHPGSASGPATPPAPCRRPRTISSAVAGEHCIVVVTGGEDGCSAELCGAGGAARRLRAAHPRDPARAPTAAGHRSRDAGRRLRRDAPAGFRAGLGGAVPLPRGAQRRHGGRGLLAGRSRGRVAPDRRHARIRGRRQGVPLHGPGDQGNLAGGRRRLGSDAADHAGAGAQTFESDLFPDRVRGLARVCIWSRRGMGGRSGPPRSPWPPGSAPRCASPSRPGSSSCRRSTRPSQGNRR